MLMGDVLRYMLVPVSDDNGVAGARWLLTVGHASKCLEIGVSEKAVRMVINGGSLNSACELAVFDSVMKVHTACIKRKWKCGAK